MRHRLRGRTLGRSPSHRLALFRNLCRALITHESIKTTVAKAKEVRPIVEKLITLAKKAAILNDLAASASGAEEKKLRAKALHCRRLAMAKLGPMHGTGVLGRDGNPVYLPGQKGEKDQPLVDRTQDTVLKKLFNVIGPRYKSRPGGYTRILKLHTRRLGDAGEQALLELLKEGEVKVKAKMDAPKMPAAPTATE